MNLLKKLFSPVRVENLMKQEIKRTESQINEVAILLFKHRQCLHHYSSQLEFLVGKTETLKKQLRCSEADHDDNLGDSYGSQKAPPQNSL